MKPFDWNVEKNKTLINERGISFENVVFHILNDGLLDTISHPNQLKYHGQKIFTVNVENYVYLVQFVENDETFFLKTIIPIRKMTKKYLGGKTDGSYR